MKKENSFFREVILFGNRDQRDLSISTWIGIILFAAWVTGFTFKIIQKVS